MTDLMATAFPKTMGGPLAPAKKATEQRLTKIAETNTNAFPPGIRTPTADELEQMRLYMLQYKKDNPKASKREIRKATQAHFNVQIYRKPFKRELK